MKKISRPKWIALFVIAGMVVAAPVAYRKYDKADQPQYRLQLVERGGVTQLVSANGTINPVKLVSVGTQVSGTVKKLFVDFNSKVQKGQILLELDDALLSAQLRQSEANLQNAQATLDLATENEKRTRSLYALEYVAKQDMDTAVQAKRSAEAQLMSARAQLEKDRANLAYSVIRSPVSGVVVDREVDVGQTVAASLQTPTLFKIAQDLSKMQIDSSFAEADIGNIRVGQTVRFTVDAFPDRHFRGSVKQIRLNPTTVSNVVTYDVVINVDNPGQILLPGMTAYVNIVVAERKDALLVPNAALRFKPANPVQTKPAAQSDRDAQKTGASRIGDSSTGGKSKRDAYTGKVYFLVNGTPKPISVTLGITDNINTEITAGELKAGNEVIIGEVLTTDNTNSRRPPMRIF